VRIVIMCGGVGGSRFALGVRRAFPDALITIIANTADDITVQGLRICPDLDTIMYGLGGGGDPDRGWGRRDERWTVMNELTAYGAEPLWFSLGDRDLATHLVRTQLLAAGLPLSQVTATLTARWFPADSRLSLLPMSNDRIETHILIADEAAPAGRRAVHFQEYWVRLHAEPDALGVRFDGVDSASPTPGLTDRLAEADLILLAPSNPVVSIGPILGVPGIRDAVRRSPAPVVGFAGVLGGAPVLGMAHRLLPAIGVEVDAASIGLHYGPRSADGVLDVWTMDVRDAERAPTVERAGMRVAIADLIMSDAEATAAFVHYAVKTALS
jgi:LPPG:FO 2-phospho-L-lactate transferase